jgi:hypothetical protein
MHFEPFGQRRQRLLPLNGSQHHFALHVANWLRHARLMSLAPLDRLAY